MKERRGRRGLISPREDSGNETGKVITLQGSVEPAKRHLLAYSLVDESKEPCLGARQIETCLAPRQYVDVRHVIPF